MAIFIRTYKPSVCQSLFDIESKSIFHGTFFQWEYEEIIDKPNDDDIGAYCALGVTGARLLAGE